MSGDDGGDCFFVERYESDIEEEGGASASSHTHKNVVKGEKQLMLIISERFLEERSSMGDKVKCAKYGECVVYTVVSRVSTHGRLNITHDFGPHGCLPGI